MRAVQVHGKRWLFKPCACGSCLNGVEYFQFSLASNCLASNSSVLPEGWAARHRLVHVSDLYRCLEEQKKEQINKYKERTPYKLSSCLGTASEASTHDKLCPPAVNTEASRGCFLWKKGAEGQKGANFLLEQPSSQLLQPLYL